MVDAHPDLKRRFINTNEIVIANNSHLIPELYSKHPEDYISIQTHKTIEKIMPWVESPSPIMQRKYGFAGERQGQSLQPIVIDKILVLGVEFSDKPAQIPIETIYKRFFGDYVNSLKEYYREVSYSRHVPHGEIHGWYLAPQSSGYYTDKQNGFGRYPNSADRLVEDVIEIASNDPYIDWASFDNNDNGYIDNLIVVHSGAEAAWTGDANNFWAHVWMIPEPKIIQGRYVWIYAMTSEYLGKPEDPQVIGGDCHEYGHLLGLPDLYDTSYETNGVGTYSLMGAGSWGNTGMTPTHLDSWSKHVLGFTDPIIDPIGTVYIDNAEQSSTNIIYTTTDPKEYFLVENRQKILYDTYLPSEGLFIWHINENQIDNQKYNNDKSCYLVGLIQADNLSDLENRANNGDLGDPYPGITNNRSFGINTNPNSMLCQKNVQKLLISYISDSTKTMIFDSSI